MGTRSSRTGLLDDVEIEVPSRPAGGRTCGGDPRRGVRWGCQPRFSGHRRGARYIRDALGELGLRVGRGLVRRDVYERARRSKKLRIVLDGMWWRDLRVQRRYLQRRMQSWPRQLQRGLCRRDEQPRKLWRLRPSLQRDRDLRRRRVHLPRRPASLRHHLRRGGERSEKLRGVWHRVWRHYPRVQQRGLRGRVR